MTTTTKAYKNASIRDPLPVLEVQSMAARDSNSIHKTPDKLPSTESTEMSLMSLGVATSEVTDNATTEDTPRV